MHTNTRLWYKEIPLFLISCLLWQRKKLLYQAAISQEGGKNYESEQRKKRKLSLLKIRLKAGKMAHTLILKARLICFWLLFKTIKDLLIRSIPHDFCFCIFHSNIVPFKNIVYKSLLMGFTIFKIVWNLAISHFSNWLEGLWKTTISVKIVIF